MMVKNLHIPMLIKRYLLFILIFIAGSSSANNLLHQADSLYIQRNYSEALQRYLLLIRNDGFLKEDFSINFKLAYCYLMNDDYSLAEQMFAKLRSDSDLLSQYLDYYLFLSSLKQDKPWLVIAKGRNYLSDHYDHFLVDSVRLKLADYQFYLKKFDAAYQDYAKLSGKKQLKKIRPYLLSQMALCRLYLNQREEALERMYQLMKKYSADRSALKMAKLYTSYSKIPEKYEFAIADVYLKHGYFSNLTERMESYIRKADDIKKKERARLYLVQIYYAKGKYQTALYGYKNLLSGLKNKTLESRLRLDIARCYLRLGQKEQAAWAYTDYAKRFPRRRMALESIWKAAWIYEELGDLRKEIDVYRYLLRHWPRSKYRHEAKFRIGLAHLRLNEYQSARNIFSAIAGQNQSDFHQNRGLYWLAKTYQKQKDQVKYEEILKELGANPFKSYYSLKSYILFAARIDSVFHIRERLADDKNPLRFHRQSMVNMIDDFEELFLIRDLMGDDIALQELSEKKYIPKTLKGWIALAEVYKKLGAYNRAFRIYDYIDNRHFADLSILDKPFLLKESYPLYYDNVIMTYGLERELDKNIILALIRAESSFNRRAHSWANAYGLMQIIPRTARSLAMEISADYSIPEDLFKADRNINLGTLYLRKLFDRFGNQFEYAIAAYNAGPHRVKRWKTFQNGDDIDMFVENIEFSQTRNYVRRVMRNFWIYQLLEKIN